MAQRRYWTYEEDEYLHKSWGKSSLTTICKRLDRSESSVINRINRLGLGSARENNCEYITLNSLATALYGNHETRGHTYATEVVFPKLLTIYMIPQPKVKRRCVKLSEFWEMAEANRYLFDFSKLEPYALGAEPDWVAEQRIIDQKTQTLRRGGKVPWNAHEVSLLKSIASKKKYTCNELAKMFRRNEGSVMRKLTELGMHKCLKKNPNVPHTQDELDSISKLILQGYSYSLLAQYTGRSEKSLRGVVYQRFGTESLAKVQAKLKNGEKLEARPREKIKKGETKNEENL